ncbi:MAG: Major facilitator superfamily 1 [Acidobacteriaceae bacterium]|nr:Major facilitator superfamily 1 [Acidobacteriaceae bacterium]
MNSTSTQMSSMLAPASTRHEEDSLGYAGWRVILAAFVGVGVSFAPMVPYTFSLFVVPLHSAFGWNREAISNAFAIAALTVAAVSPGIGSLLDRIPPRRIILPSILIFAAAMASLAFLRGHIAQYYLSYLLLGVVGNGTAQLSYSRSVLTWFRKRRGLALAIVLSGSGTGSILLPIIAQHVISSHGWRAAYLSLAAIAFVGFPLTALFVRNRPAAAATTAIPEHGLGIGLAFRTRAFWIISVSVMLSAFSVNAIIAHLAAILVGRGITAGTAALALSAMGIAAIIARLFTGHLLDRLPAPFVAFAVLLIAATGAAAVAYATTSSIGILGAILMGAGSGSEADVIPYMLAEYFGRRRFATLYGLSWTAYAIGGALGPILMGHGFDRAGTYVPLAVVLFSVPCFIAGGMQLLLPRQSEFPAPDHIAELASESAV